DGPEGLTESGAAADERERQHSRRLGRPAFLLYFSFKNIEMRRIAHNLSRSTLRAAASGALVVSVWAGAASAQERGIGTPPPAARAAEIVATAQLHMKAGETRFLTGDFDHAREEFDQALDAFLLSGYDLRADAEIQAAYRDTLER